MLTIAILNNMPDSAVRTTERQLTDLLNTAADTSPVQVRWFAFNPRDGYGSLDDLLALKHVDGLIVTGNEPKTRRLNDEVYWETFTQVVGWAAQHTTSTIWSCLAAHAAVLQLDGIERSPLRRKLHGVFEVEKLAKHPLLSGMDAHVAVPHSRWNTLDCDVLQAHGYTVLTASDQIEVGADICAKRVGTSLYVMLQGHWEYDGRALMREYRRDVLRYISGERDDHPNLPWNYFQEQTFVEMARLADLAMVERSVDIMTEMQTVIGKANLTARWRPNAVQLYRNWLRLLSTTRATLFPSTALRKQFDDTLTNRLATARERVIRGSVTPTFNYTEFARQLAAYNFESQRELPEVAGWLIDQLETGSTHITSPRYFGLFNPTPTFPAQCADRIAAVFNPQLATSTTSPAAVAIENHVIVALARRFGLPDPAGHFTSGGSEANYTALLLALSKACPAFIETGARGFVHHPVFYISNDSHLAWIKIAQMAGIGRNAARRVETDGSGRMDAEALAKQIEDDIATGHHPVMIVATAGTTTAGMIDPLDACALLAKQWNMWLHVDAAWGGAAITSEMHRDCLLGINNADSITVDAHKWFATTMGCGMILTRHPSLLAETFKVAAYFMPSGKLSDPYVTSLQWSRRFVGSRLFLSLAVAGWRGYGEHVEQTLRLAELLRRQLTERGWHVCNQSPLGVLCIEPKGKSAKEIVQGVLSTGRAWVSVASFEGREVIRACVTSGETTENDVYDLVNSLDKES